MSTLAMGSVASTTSLAPAGRASRLFSILMTGRGHLSPRASRRCSSCPELVVKDQHPVDAIIGAGIGGDGDAGAGGIAGGEHAAVLGAVAPTREGFGKGGI